MLLKHFCLLLFTATLLNACFSRKNSSATNEYDLLNSTWQYSDSDNDRIYNITFARKGKLKSTHPNDRTPDNDTWEQNGENVTFYFNNKYATYVGKFYGKDSIKGSASNNQNTWSFLMVRKR
jgi:outer membrane biogenesis lipoprotein LolB